MKLIASVCRRQAALTRAAVLSQWHAHAGAAKMRLKLQDCGDRCAESELMVAFLKEQLTDSGVPALTALPESSLVLQQVDKAVAVLDGLLTQIPTGIVGEFEVDAAVALQGASASACKGDAAALLMKLEMLWAEVRELVATSSAAAGDAPAPGPGGGGAGVLHGSTKGISHELVIARLRGKIDQLTKTVEEREAAVAALQSKLERRGGEEREEERAAKMQVARHTRVCVYV